jgi:HK97 gp10 family phage protein
MTLENQNVHGLAGVLDMLKELPQEIVAKNGGVVRTALRKGAAPIVREWKRNIAAVIQAPNKGGKDGVSTGALIKAVGVVKSRNPRASGANEMQTIKVRKRPRVRNLTPAQYIRDLEYGSERQEAKPTLMPAYYSKRQETLDTIVSELHKGIAKAIQKGYQTARSKP